MKWSAGFQPAVRRPPAGRQDADAPRAFGAEHSAAGTGHGEIARPTLGAHAAVAVREAAAVGIRCRARLRQRLAAERIRPAADIRPHTLAIAGALVAEGCAAGELAWRRRTGSLDGDVLPGGVGVTRIRI